MSMQVMLPSEGAWQGVVRGSSERLEALRADVVETKYQLREMLERLGKRHDIRQIDLDAAMECYVNDLLADLTFRVEQHLENEYVNDLLADLTFRVEQHLENEIETETQR
jgi:hypothetical protein